jgi:hypothetical protein
MRLVFVRRELSQRTVRSGLAVGARFGVIYSQSFSPPPPSKVEGEPSTGPHPLDFDEGGRMTKQPPHDFTAL